MNRATFHKFIVEACLLSLIWQMCAVISIYLWSPGMFVDALPDLFFGKMIAQELLLIALISILIFITLRILFEYIFSFNKNIADVFSYFVYVLFVTVYVFSWLQFFIYGKFINLSSIEMFFSSPIQMLLHATDLMNISVYRLAVIPTVLLVILYASKRYVLDVVPHKILLTIFLSLNLVCAFFNTLSINEEPYRKKFLVVNNDIVSLADFMRYVKVGAASPFVTLKESVINQLLADHAGQSNSGVEFSNIHPLPDVDSLMRLSQLKDWDVIIVEIESLHPKMLAATNADLLESVMPAVDSIAAESQIFTNAYAQSSHSSYSDLVPLASQYPLRSKNVYIYPEHIPFPKVLIYDVLDKYGYKSAIISSQNENWQGMNHYLNSPSLDIFIHAGNFKQALDKYNIDISSINTYENKEAKKDPMVSFAGKFADSTTISIINNWLGSLNPGQRYFLYTNLQNSHFPFYSPPGRAPVFFKSKQEEERARNNARERIDFNANELQTLYKESLGSIDDEIQRLVDNLKHLGRWENTLVVITADTSMRISESFIGNGGDLYQDVLHVPLIIKVPGELARKDTRLMQHLDVTPTVLGYMGLHKHPGFQGKDFSVPNICNSYSFAVAQTPLAYQYSVISDDGWHLTYDDRINHVKLEPLNSITNSKEVKEGKKKEDLLNVLKTWMGGQLRYYENEVLMNQKYPPSFNFINSSCN